MTAEYDVLRDDGELYSRRLRGLGGRRQTAVSAGPQLTPSPLPCASRRGSPSYLVNWLITVVFFIPGVVAFNKVDTTGPPSPELAERGRRWLQRSWGRHLLTVAAAFALLVALAQ
jgi:hypothetical protein